MTQPAYLIIKDNPEAERIFNNFARDCFRDEGYDAWEKVLSDYNAVHRYQASKQGIVKKHYIRFGSERDLTAFLLRYA